MADIKRRAREIHSELGSFHETLGEKLGKVEEVFEEFQNVEDQCTDMDLSYCLKLHDDFKLRRAELLRRRYRLQQSFQQLCVGPQLKGWSWRRSLSIISEADLETAERFLACYRPFMSKFFENAAEEEALFREGLLKLQPMVPKQGS